MKDETRIKLACHFIQCSYEYIVPGRKEISGSTAFMEKIIGIVSGIFTSAAMLPQFFKLIKKKNSKDISLGMLLVLIIGIAGWIWYGFLKHDMIIIVTNTFAFILNALTLILSIKYRNR